MPELPDVEIYRQTSLEAKDKRIGRVSVSDERILHCVSPQKLRLRLKGRQIVDTQRRGKHLLLQLDDGTWLTLHFGMTGRLAYFRDIKDDPPRDCLRIDFVDGSHLAYESLRELGRVGICDDADAFFAAENLGTDAIDRKLTFKAFCDALNTRGDVKSALMHQEKIAGIGNIYSDEILFQARIHPKTKCHQLNRDSLRQLFDQMKRVLRRAIRRGAESEGTLDRFPKNFLISQRKKDGRCPRCSCELQRVKVSGRSAYFCPRCQVQPG